MIHHSFRATIHCDATACSAKLHFSGPLDAGPEVIEARILTAATAQGWTLSGDPDGGVSHYCPECSLGRPPAPESP